MTLLEQALTGAQQIGRNRLLVEDERCPACAHLLECRHCPHVIPYPDGPVRTSPVLEAAAAGFPCECPPRPA